MICLYAARELSTAWAEYNQGFVQHPTTIVQLVLKDAKLANLTSDVICTEFGVPPGIQSTQWRDDIDNGRVPATHGVAEQLRARGCNGVIYPSIMSPGGSCVALWRWNAEGAPTLRVIDPEGRLPKGQASWL